MKSVSRAIFLLAVLALTSAVSAQTPPSWVDSAEEYDAWKAQFTTPAPEVPPHPTEDPDDGAGTERDSVITCDCWITPDASYTTINNSTEWNASGWGNGDDGSYGPVNLPFSFYLYGQNYNQVYININGNLSFGTFVTGYNSSGFPNTLASLVAPFWADVDLRVPGSNLNKVQYKVTPTALYVNWTNVGYYNQQTDKLNSFQVIISNGSDPVINGNANVSFCYGEMEWTTGSASNGINGFGGTPATVGANKGDGVNYIQFGRFDHPGTDYNGPFGAPGGIGWLSHKSFTFATDITTGNLTPVVSGQSVCDTLTVCSGVPSLLTVDFLSPEPTQLTSATSWCNTLGNYTIVDSTSGNTATITSGFTASLAEVGFHDVYFEGTDNGTPVQTGTLHIVIHVLPSPQLSSDTLAVCSDNGPVDMLTVLGGAPPPGGTWNDPAGNAHGGFFDPLTDPVGAYAYTVSTGGQCSATGTAYMTVQTPVNAGGDTTLAFCSWDLATPLFPLIPGNPQSGGTWTDPAGAVFNGTLDPASAASGTYSYLLPGVAPCPNDTAFLNIAVPQAVDAGDDNSITLCRDEAPFSMRGRLLGTPDPTGTWTDVGGNPVQDLFDPATGTIGVYNYTVPAVLPCPDQTAVLTINLDAIPQAGVDSALVICANGGYTPLFPLLGGNPDQGGHWLAPDGTTLPDGLLDPALELSGTYRYVAIGPGTCAHLSDTAAIAVHIDPLPVITFTADVDSGCAPLDVTFTNTTDPIYVGGSCVWDFGDGSDPVDACGSIAHTYTDSGWYHLKLRVTTPEGCTDQLIAPGAVLVDPPPVASFVYTPNPITAGNNRVVFTATDKHAVQFLWTMPDLGQPDRRQVAYTFPDAIADTFTVCLDVADRYGCRDSFCDTSLAVLVPNLWLPNAFTPDGNGVNDVFRPVMLDMVAADYHLYIFDRWGGIVFESTDPDEGWDGLVNGGMPASTGVYVWRIIYRPVASADLAERFGTVTLNH